MSMEVDLNTPLTGQEREYLAERGRYAEIERVDAMYGVETPAYAPGDGTGPEVMPLLTSEQKAAERDRLRARLAELEAEEGNSEDAEPDPYEVWKVQELDDELKRRQLSTSGSKQDKVDRLYKNDEEAAAATPQS